jgi:predicted nuclease of restriction endonuclease-like (RecB) superfamily
MKETPSPSFESFYNKVKSILEDARSNVYRVANTEMVQAYWSIGREIIEEEQKGESRAEYGTYLIKQLAEKLTNKYGKGFDERNLFYMKQFFLAFPKMNALRSELSWTHYRILMRLEREDARAFYLQESVDGNWSTRQLERQVSSHYFERMVMTQKDYRSLVKQEADSKKEQMEPAHIIKDPYVLEFLNLKSNTSFYESELEQALIDKLREFLLELGKGFSFVSRQYRISAGSKHFYVDLVFYNYILKCFLLIDLKTGELTHQVIGQMDFYVRYFEDQVRQGTDNPTIGLILCAESNRTIVKYSLLKDSKQIFASKYKLYLPTEKELKRELTREREMIEQEKRLKQ